MYECRICLEEDELNNLISPCLCKGTLKYVHKNCLNEWRIVSNNEINMKKCSTCNFEYIIKNNNNCETRTNIILKILEKNIFYKILLNFVFILFSSLLIYIIFQKFNTLQMKNLIYWDDSDYININCINIGLLIVSIIYNIAFFFRICVSKNKILILKYYMKNNIFVILLYQILTIFLIFTLPILGSILSFIILSFYLHLLIKEINNINKTDNLEIISLTDHDIHEF